VTENKGKILENRYWFQGDSVSLDLRVRVKT
jgi:hypothetical protein